jgi:hypothetical protein
VTQILTTVNLYIHIMQNKLNILKIPKPINFGGANPPKLIVTGKLLSSVPLVADHLFESKLTLVLFPLPALPEPLLPETQPLAPQFRRAQFDDIPRNAQFERKRINSY